MSASTSSSQSLANTFANNNWNAALQTDKLSKMERNLNFDSMPGYCKLKIDLYKNTQYNQYITWLTTGGASTVKSSAAETSQATLNVFIDKAKNQYDDLTLNMLYSFTNLTGTNQEVGWCIEPYYIKNGITCVFSSTGSSADGHQKDTYQYFFPA